VGGEIEPGTRTVPARILIADDHDLVRDGLKYMLSYEEDLEAVGEASNGREAVELCRRLKPDLVLMDIRMPQMDGMEATRAIKAQQPEISVLIITTHENPDYLLEAIKAGAAGYVLKDASNQRLVSGMRRVLEGESPINQELATQLIQHLASEVPQPAELPLTIERGTASTLPLLEEMTPRELEVLRLMAEGKTNQEIAESLFITRATAKVHVQHIFRKLGVSDRTQAVVHAFKLGLAPYRKIRP
jgi:DNA-binding NarL/FixJ family response regulator